MDGVQDAKHAAAPASAPASARLCDICRNLDFASILQPQNIYRPKTKEYVSIQERAILYHLSFGSLRANSEICDFCHLVLHATGLDGDQKDGRDDLNNFQLYLADAAPIGGIQVFIIDKDNSDILDLLGGIGFCVEHGSPLGAIIKGHKIPTSPRSPSVLSQIKDWMQGSKGEEANEQPNLKPLPTRLLEIVDGGERVKLYTPETVTGQYAALSHCWGAQQPLTLTWSTIEMLALGLTTAQLPQTFQDAIWLTCQLGIQYLWIDSFCILQDDHDDWIQESAKMCDIYRNSTLTIAATKAAGNSEGFLGDRPERKYVSIPFYTEQISGHALAFALSPNMSQSLSRSIELEGEPLSSRGWALQERHLPQRILHFGREQIYFESKPVFSTEDCTIATVMVSHGTWTEEMDRGYLEQRAEQDGDWHRMVEVYSKRKLTYEKDKLPAIAGLAARFPSSSILPASDSKSKARYVAGLWADRLIQGLCWRRNKQSPNGVRPKKFRSPTWSWASIDGEVKYNFGSRWKSQYELARIENVHVELESSRSPFGCVADAWIHLKSNIFSIHLSDTWPGFFAGRDGEVVLIDVVWDAESYKPPVERTVVDSDGGETELFAAPLVWTGPLDAPDSLVMVFFIILKRVNHKIKFHSNTKAFKRVGAGHGIWGLDDEGGLCNSRMEELATKKWTVTKEKGYLTELILY